MSSDLDRVNIFVFGLVLIVVDVEFEIYSATKAVGIYGTKSNKGGVIYMPAFFNSAR